MGLKAAVQEKPAALLGEGWVWHARPSQTGRGTRLVSNAFRYPIFNILVPVHQTAEVNALESGRWLSLSARDYLDGKSGPLERCIRDFLRERLSYECDEIWLQTLPRLLGYGFNPVSFWRCYSGGRLDAVLCEVNNTFGDRHFYFVKDPAAGAKIELPKVFHVSPFFRRAGTYTFEFHDTADKRDVRIQLFEEAELKLDTRITLRLEPLASVPLGKLLLRYGWLTAMVMIRIHYQALKLWLKGAVFFTRPEPIKEKVTHVDSRAR